MYWTAGRFTNWFSWVEPEGHMRSMAYTGFGMRNTERKHGQSIEAPKSRSEIWGYS